MIADNEAICQASEKGAGENELEWEIRNGLAGLTAGLLACHPVEEGAEDGGVHGNPRGGEAMGSEVVEVGANMVLFDLRGEERVGDRQWMGTWGLV